MNILSIETSCDETAISIVEAQGDFPNATYALLGNALFSQIEIHREYGGVFPAIAKREHAKTLVPMLEQAFQEAKFAKTSVQATLQEHTEAIHHILYREAGLGDAIISFLEKYEKPPIDLIAVTTGPGLEPALWVGISFARALSYYWNIPIVPINHMEGHILSSIFTKDAIPQISFPAIVLLISGGHTELVLMKDWTTYVKIGETVDDAVGEAFDKVARMLGLPYPGGPEISARAAHAREENLPIFKQFPRPMLDADNLNFSFSGLKTAVRYAIGTRELSEEEKASIARDFEDAVTEVLLKKSIRAVDLHGAQTVIVGGGVSANIHIREEFTTYFKTTHPELTLFFPPRNLSTDNSVMIALAGHAHAHSARSFADFASVKADGNLSIETEQ